MTQRDLIPHLLDALKASIEDCTFLRHGRAFMPEYLKSKKLSLGFYRVMGPLARRLKLQGPKEQVANHFEADYQIGHRQIVDYVLMKKSRPIFYVELETLDRAQLSTFWDPPGLEPEDSSNKLWHYYGTLAKRHQSPGTGPRYFVWLLILPDSPVGPYSLWDLEAELGFFQPKFRRPIRHLIRQSPYRFYDPLIKLAAREFLQNRSDDIWLKVAHGSRWERRQIPLGELQHECELIFVTITGSHLVLSRGSDLFDPNKEQKRKLHWESARRRRG